MLYGQYEHQLDTKNRLRLPAKLKAGLGEHIHVLKGTSSCLFIFSEEEFEAFSQKLMQISMFDAQKQKPAKLMLASGADIEEDNQGRFLLPQYLRSVADLKKDVVFIGVGNHVELWSKEKWNAYSEISDDEYDNLLSGLAEAGI